MVAEITGKDIDEIFTDMPLAIGRQYEQIFYAKHNVKTKSFVGVDKNKNEGLRKIIK
jgi:hypothetical protein